MLTKFIERAQRSVGRWRAGRRADRMVARLRREREEAERSGPSPTEKLVTLLLIDALRKNASEIRFVFGRSWHDGPHLFVRTMVDTCSVFYVLDGETREVMRPPGRLAPEIAETVMRRLGREYRADGNDVTEFAFVPPPRNELDEGPPVHTTTFRVEVATEGGNAVLILRPV